MVEVGFENESEASATRIECVLRLCAEEVATGDVGIGAKESRMKKKESKNSQHHNHCSSTAQRER